MINLTLLYSSNRRLTCIGRPKAPKATHAATSKDALFTDDAECLEFKRTPTVNPRTGR